MPRLSAFYGIVIYMYWDEHPPAHYHAKYGEHEAVIIVADRRLAEGSLPRRAVRLVREWHGLHQAELEEAWRRISAEQPPGTIEPLP